MPEPMSDISDLNHHSGHYEIDMVTYWPRGLSICWGPTTVPLTPVNISKPGHRWTGNLAGHKALEGITRGPRGRLGCWGQGRYIHERKG